MREMEEKLWKWRKLCGENKGRWKRREKEKWNENGGGEENMDRVEGEAGKGWMMAVKD